MWTSTANAKLYFLTVCVYFKILKNNYQKVKFLVPADFIDFGTIGLSQVFLKL
jgi:hypothetical protein